MVLPRFSDATRSWFEGAFEQPTAAQEGAWAAVSGGEHALVVAPTGSGKTLAAFLWALDGLLTDESPPDPAARCRVLYVSPLKALATDVERNLRSPLVGIRQAAARLGRTLPDVSVGIRTGDTPPAERRAFATRPPDILITTPESLYLVLTSAARSGLSGVRTVIVDEIHAVAGTKRGAHLALSLERLDALLDRPDGPGPAQRIGLSATVRPVETVAEFLGGARAAAAGGRTVRVVQPPSTKRIDVDVVVPVPDLTELAVPSGPGAGDEAPGADLTGTADRPLVRPSIWPHVEERVVDLVARHRSTLVFTNSRRGAERLTSRINEVWAGRQGVDVPDPGTLQVAAVPAQSGTAVGVDTRDAATILARAHHGSMSRAERTRTESELKAGRLPAVVATSSLELGIDMGAVDLVVQVGTPPSVASGLQRVGRAGHQVGAVSRGVVFPTFRGELVPAAVTAERMRDGVLEPMSVPRNPLDVLAQQVVAMVAVDDWSVDDLAAVVRRAAPFATLGDATLRAVLDMLAGRYPSEEFAELRPRLVWDRVTDVLTARPGALRLAVTSGGTIPDRGQFGVFLASGAATEDVPVDAERAGGRVRGGRRVGELDEEMVYESRVGDTFTLGSSTWRIEDITPDRVLVSPAPGVPGRLPFWKGDSQGRPAELGRAMGAWVRELGTLPEAAARDRVEAAGLDPWAADNLLTYLAEQRAATGELPTDAVLVVERFRDELGDWRVVLHSPYGARVHAPWAVVVGARLRERYGVDAAAMHADDGIVLRLPDVLDAGDEPWDGADADGPGIELSDLLLEPEEVLDVVRTELASSTMFGARFREAASRALLLPRRRPDRRQPLWQQRQRAAQLLQVAAQYPDFPILLEAVRECLQDDFDTDALTGLMRDIGSGRVRVVEVTTPQPSPFAQALLFGYTAQFLYDGDAPLAERRAAALTLDPTLLAELLGQGGESQLADLLDPAAVVRTEAELAGTAPDRLVRSVEGLADVLRRHGPVTADEAALRVVEEHRADVPTWLTELAAARRAIRVRLGGLPPERADQWAAVEDAGRLRDALGVALPVGVPEVFTELVPDPVGDLLRRHARTRGPFTAASAAARFGVGVAVVTETLRRLETAGVLVQGRLRPDELGGTGDEFCDAQVLRTLRRRSLAALRAQVEPVDPQALGVFLPRWQGVQPARLPGRSSGSPGLRGVDGVARVVEQLAGVSLPASAWETHVLPARVPDYAPAMLDELTAAGEVLWAGHGALAGHDGLVSLHPTSVADLTLPPARDRDGDDPTATPLHAAVLDALTGGGAWFLHQLVERVRTTLPTDDGVPPPSGTDVAGAVWDLVWAGLVTNDSLAPLRAWLGSGSTAHRSRAPAPRGRALRPRLGLRAGLRVPGAGATALDGPASAGGRWSLLPQREPDPTLRAHATAAQLLDRHGVLTRAVAPSEGLGARFTDVYRVLSALENGGQVRRGYFVERLGGSQFALPGAVDRLRVDAQVVDRAAERAADSRDAPGDAWAHPGPTTSASPDTDAVVVVLAATDPANPYGAALAWPAAERPPAGPGVGGGPTSGTGAVGASGVTGRHRPGRKAGALVVLVDGALVLYLERGGRTALSFVDDEPALAAAAQGLAEAVRTRHTGRLTVSRLDGAEVLADGALHGPVGRALVAAGFAPTPRGLRLRGQS
ncbi:ATP-dependent helicase [Cellulomonas fimi]|uniref:DEAD/H associated domain protein n=1 Tax=Cellulomonas fimi (strain ATCC 484 / DSM 20113 / JCM 1341 / CCUG 24087 / LMG 16345 / NBRC 15513 / NCIMB 8980 / NCTC 7547 / NRS-133) TaxID=590998 RepID=F4H764_CELFA|nr:ATP-dependent helicase [Cellulomonas fimi]AEE45698.1 DEAD/H associated domain protein [Cellulomonas fimi ATCC 484]NNH07385.1 ATP-dependent helicase [Cellulomonas fimi]VEH30325.1 putative ATP-dependent helicase Lhr [Cellulomonas fimi]